MPERKGLKYLEPYLPHTLREAFNTVANDPELGSLREELAALRLMLGKYIEANPQVFDGEVDSIKDAILMLREVRDTVTAIAAVEGRLRAYIPVAIMPVVLTQICEVVKEFMPDERMLARLSERLGQVPLERGSERAFALPQPGLGRQNAEREVLDGTGSPR